MIYNHQTAIHLVDALLYIVGIMLLPMSHGRSLIPCTIYNNVANKYDNVATIYNKVATMHNNVATMYDHVAITCFITCP